MISLITFTSAALATITVRWKRREVCVLVTENVGKWPSGHGQATKIRPSGSSAWKIFQWRCKLGMLGSVLKVIWEIPVYLLHSLNWRFSTKKYVKWQSVGRFHHVFEKPFVGAGKPLGKRGLRRPAHLPDTGVVQQFLRGPVRFIGIEGKFSLEANDPGDGFRQFPDGQFLAGAEVDLHRPRVILHKENQGIRQIIPEQELPPGIAGAPDDEVGSFGLLGLVGLSHQRRDDVAGP